MTTDALQLFDLIECADLTQLARRIGFTPRDDGGMEVLDECPFRARCPRMAHETELAASETYVAEALGGPRFDARWSGPRVLLSGGGGWYTLCCAQLGGPREFAAAALGLLHPGNDLAEVIAQHAATPGALAKVAASAIRAHRTNLDLADERVRRWAMQHAPDTTLGELAAVMGHAADTVASEEARSAADLLDDAAPKAANG